MADKTLEETEREIDRNLAKSKEIAAKSAEIQRNLAAAVPEAGTIKRLTSLVSAAQPVDAIYRANEESFKSNTNMAKVAGVFLESYAKSFTENIKTAATGRDFTRGQKTYKDIITKQMGMKDGALATALGLAGDIAIDPSSFGGFKLAATGMGKVLGAGGKQALKIPQVSKVFDSIQGAFNLFHQVEKVLPADKLTELKSAFRVAVESKDFSDLQKLGLDVSKYTKKAAPQNAPNAFRAANGQILPYKEVYKTLESAFGPKAESGIIGKGLDWTSGIYKRAMSWSPKFQSRNFMGALTQGVSEGSTFKDYIQAAKLLMTKGKSRPYLYDTLQRNGVLSQTGMFEQGAGKFPAWVANKGESLNRTALAISQFNKGFTLEEAIAKTEKVFYKYAPAYLTATEKQIKRVLPFYTFQKGQLSYWPEALSSKGAFWSALGKTKRATEPSDPLSKEEKPSWWKDMFSVGSVGNIGFQLEDFLKNMTGDVRNIWSQVQPVLSGLTEGALDWNIFKGKSISGDTKAGQYQHLGPLNKVVGYDAESQTVNPWSKFAVEKMFGPILQPIKDLFDPTKSIWRSVTSVRPYDLSSEKIAWQNKKEKEESGQFLKNLFARFGFGTAAQAATPNSPVPVRIFGIDSSTIANFKSPSGKGYFDAPFEVEPGEKGRKEMYRYRKGAFVDATRQNQTIVSTDPRVNARQEWTAYDRLYKEMEKEPGVGPEGSYNLRMGNYKHHQATAPRSAGQGFFSSDLLKSQTTLGQNFMEIAFNQSQKEYGQFLSKVGEAFKKNGTSFAAIQKSIDVQIQGFEQLQKMSRTKFSQADVALKKQSIYAEAQKALDKLEEKVLKAQAEMLDDLADSEIEGVNRVEAKKLAALAKFEASKEARLLKEADPQQYELAKAAKGAIWDRKLQEQTAKDARILAETMGDVLKDTMANTLAALKSIYERGGLTAEQYAAKQTEAYRSKAKEGMINWIQAAIKEITPAASDAPLVTPAGTDTQLPAITPPQRATAEITQKTKPKKGTVYCFPNHPEILVTWDGKKYDILFPKELGGDKNLGAGFQNLTSKFLPYMRAKGSEAPPWSAKSYASQPTVGPLVSAQPATPEVAADSKKLMADLAVIAEKLGKSTSDKEDQELAKQATDLIRQATTNHLGNTANLETAFKGLTNDITAEQKARQDVTDGLIKNNDQLRAATIEMMNFTRNIKTSTYDTQTSTHYGLGFDEKMMPTMFSPDVDALVKGADEKRKNDLLTKDMGLAKQLQAGTQNMKDGVGMLGGQNFVDATNIGPEETGRTYMERLKATIAGEKAIAAAQGQEGAARLANLTMMENAVSTVMAQSNANQVQSAQAVAQARVQIVSNMASNIEQAASIIYESSGRQSKEAFYVMKAASVANIIIKGIEATMSAYTAGLSVGGPYAPAIGAAYAATAAALAGAQLGAALAVQPGGGTGGSSPTTSKYITTFTNMAGEKRGEKVQYITKARGGKITGGSGTKDDVPVMAMGGEYFMQKKAVEKYGEGFMEALNWGLIDIPEAITDTVRKPRSYAVKSHFASGGMVIPEKSNKKTEITMINVTDPRELDRYLATTAGQNAVLNVLSSRNQMAKRIIGS